MGYGWLQDRQACELATRCELIVASRNWAINNAKGSYIGFLDDDDEEDDDIL